MHIYRRHTKTCKHRHQRLSRVCDCRLWVKGILRGKPYEKSLKTRSITDAQTQLAYILKHGEEPQHLKEEKTITINDALDAFIKDCEARNLSRNTLRKYRTLEKNVAHFAKDRGIDRCPDFTADLVRDFRNSRNLSAIASAKELQHVRTFFNFCISQDWITKNSAKQIRPPKVNDAPRLPFSEKEIQAILAKAKDDRERAFILTLRHTGLRIGDASLLKTSHLSDGRIFLRTTKAGTPVSIVIPPTLTNLLKSLDQRGGYFFLRGESVHPHTASNSWRKRIKAICKELNIVPDHPHRFRHSLAAELLSHGVSVENVSAILGNTPAIVSRHYAQWIQSRQDALDAALQKTWEQPKLALVKK